MMLAMATKATNETDAAIGKLSNEIEQRRFQEITIWHGEPSDLEALRRDLKTAEANATAFMPRYIALLKTNATMWKNTRSRYIWEKIPPAGCWTTSTSGTPKSRPSLPGCCGACRFLSRLRKLCRVLVGEFGAYKVVNGQFIFPFTNGDLTMSRPAP